MPKQVDEAYDLAMKLMGFTEEPEAEQTTDTPTETPIEQKEEEPVQEEHAVEEAVEEEVKPEEEQNPPADDLDELRKYKARYDSLRGKYDSEVPKLQKELNELKDKFFASLEKAPEKETPKTSEALEKLRADYGDEFLATLTQYVKEQVDPIIDDKVKPVKETVKSFEDAQLEEAKTSFVSTLNKSVKGDWEKAWSGEDEGFIEFLNTTDPNGLYTYAELADKANADWDAAKLSKIFNIYFDSKAPKREEAKPEVKPKEVKPKPIEEAMIAPSRDVSNPATPPATDKMVWTKDAIAQFQKDDRKGKYDSETSKKMWDDLLSAMGDGRIRP